MQSWNPIRLSLRAVFVSVLACTVNLGGVLLLFTDSEEARAETTQTTAPTVCPPMTGLQRRLVLEASRGADALRRYIWLTRSIYGLDFVETVAWLDVARERSVGCGRSRPQRQDVGY